MAECNGIEHDTKPAGKWEDIEQTDPAVPVTEQIRPIKCAGCGEVFEEKRPKKEA